MVSLSDRFCSGSVDGDDVVPGVGDILVDGDSSMVTEPFKNVLLCSSPLSIEVVVHNGMMGEVVTIYGCNGENDGDGGSGSEWVVSMGRNDNDLTASMTMDTNVMINRVRGGDDVVADAGDNGIGDDAATESI